MEIYAAFMEHADFHVGRVIDAMADLGVLDDTLIYYIVGDNGASAEGTTTGCFSEWLVGEAPDLNTPELLIERINDLGTSAHDLTSRGGAVDLQPDREGLQKSTPAAAKSLRDILAACRAKTSLIRV